MQISSAITENPVFGSGVIYLSTAKEQNMIAAPMFSWSRINKTNQYCAARLQISVIYKITNCPYEEKKHYTRACMHIFIIKTSEICIKNCLQAMLIHVELFNLVFSYRLCCLSFHSCCMFDNWCCEDTCLVCVCQYLCLIFYVVLVSSYFVLSFFPFMLCVMEFLMGDGF